MNRFNKELSLEQQENQNQKANVCVIGRSRKVNYWNNLENEIKKAAMNVEVKDNFILLSFRDVFSRLFSNIIAVIILV